MVGFLSGLEVKYLYFSECNGVHQISTPAHVRQYCLILQRKMYLFTGDSFLSLVT